MSSAWGLPACHPLLHKSNTSTFLANLPCLCHTVCQTKPRPAKPNLDQPTKTHPVSWQFRSLDFNGIPSSLPFILSFHLLHLNVPIIEVHQCIHYQTSPGTVTLSFFPPSSKSQLFWCSTSFTFHVSQPSQTPSHDHHLHSLQVIQRLQLSASLLIPL